MMYERQSRKRTLVVVASGIIGGIALVGAACGGGTSSADKTSTVVAKGGASTPAATKAVASTSGTTPTKPAGTSTKAAGTPAASGTSASGTTGSASVNVGDTAIGKVLVDNKGMTLYTFKNDIAGSGKSTVPAAILPNWPPLTASASGAETNGAGVTGDLATASLDDGTKVVTYKGLPLYHFVNDTAVGDTKGDKLGGIWFVAVP
jgi:predicted lipoprotein with Yx(FWY)xxD motif